MDGSAGNDDTRLAQSICRKWKSKIILKYCNLLVFSNRFLTFCSMGSEKSKVTPSTVGLFNFTNARNLPSPAPKSRTRFRSVEFGLKGLFRLRFGEAVCRLLLNTLMHGLLSATRLLVDLLYSTDKPLPVNNASTYFILYLFPVVFNALIFNYWNVKQDWLSFQK